MRYHVPPLSRIDVDDLLLLIGEWKYFLLHAPRHTGKTPAMLALRDQLNAASELRCVGTSTSMSVRRLARTSRRVCERSSVSSQATRHTLDEGFVGKIWRGTLDKVGPNDALGGCCRCGRSRM